MITYVEKPTKEQLQPLLDEALESVDESALIASHVDGLVELIKHSPLSYRNYGPYWWGLKMILREHGFDFGQDDEPITREHFHYPDTVCLLVAAWAYQDYQTTNGYQFASIHEFQLEDEVFEYSLEDTDLEALEVG